MDSSSWLDGAFFELITLIMSTANYFSDQAVFLGKIIFTISFGIMALKWAMGKTNLSEEFFKRFFSLIVFWVILSNYPNILNGIQDITYRWSFDSLYTEKIVDYMNKISNDAQLAEEMKQWSGIISQYDAYEGGQPVKKYTVDLFHPDYHYIRPNSIMRFTMLIAEKFWNAAKASKLQIGQGMMYVLIFFVVVVCGSLSMVVYCIAVLEYALISTIGTLLIPFMLWDGSKFITEKLIGGILGTILKVFMLTYVMMLVFVGYLGMLDAGALKGSIDEVVGVLFLSFLFVTLTLSAPQLATTLMSGTPQLGFADLAAGAAAMAAGAKVGGGAMKSAASAGYKASGTMAQGIGAFQGARQMGGSKAQGIGAVGASLGESAKNTMKNAGHSLFQSVNGKKSGGSFGGLGGGGGSSPSRFSQSGIMNAKTEQGDTKTSGEYMSHRASQGQDIGANYMAGKINGKGLGGQGVKDTSEAPIGTITSGKSFQGSLPGKRSTLQLPNSNVIYGNAPDKPGPAIPMKSPNVKPAVEKGRI